MIGRQERWQEDLFVAGPLRDLIPEDHILRRVDGVLELGWLRAEVADLYDEGHGRPGIDPESALRLMLAGLLLGIVHDRKLMHEAQVNIAIRWFAGYRLTDVLPDHSSLTRIRQRWGEARFLGIFKQTVNQCVRAGLVRGDITHIDATLIRADVSWESLVERHVEIVKQANGDGDDDKDDGEAKGSTASGPRSRAGQPKKFSPTDPDATLATSCKQYRMEPCFKQHTAVDDQAGVIVDVHVTTGEASEGHELEAQIERVEQVTGGTLEAVTADAGYAHAANYAMLEQRGIDAIIPPQQTPRHTTRLPMALFQYDARHQIVRCPQGQVLTRRGRAGDGHGWLHRAERVVCQGCARRVECVPPSAKARTIRVSDHHEALLRARRRHTRREPRFGELYSRHRWRSEGVHGEGKTCHGLRRAVRRGFWNVRIQCYLTAAVMNLKRLAALLRALRRRYGLIIQTNLTSIAHVLRLEPRRTGCADNINVTAQNAY